MIQKLFKTAMLATCLLLTHVDIAPAQTKLTIATVSNEQTIQMQRMADDFTAKHPGIELDWVTLEENLLRQRVNQDIVTGGGQFDVVTIGAYEIPIWAQNGWLVSLNDLPSEYDTDDLIPAIRSSLTVDGELYAAPFYGESSMLMYRTDLMELAGLEMPEAPTWEFIKEAAAAMTDKNNKTYGICLRGKAGHSENITLLTAMAHSFGARWFNENREPQFDSEAWNTTLEFYTDLMIDYGPPDASSKGFDENLLLFEQGRCGIWIDATVAATSITNAKISKVADRVGFALAPDNGLGARSSWLWSQSLAVPASTSDADAAKKFIAWATSREYQQLVADAEGWANVPPGTRTSLYENPDYQASAPYAKMTQNAINSANPLIPSIDSAPYVGVQFAAIPKFPGIASAVGQQFSAALDGATTVEEALSNAQEITQNEVSADGYNELAEYWQSRGIAAPSNYPSLSKYSTEDYFAAEIFFGTNRKNTGTVPNPKFGSERSRKLTLGSTIVTIPVHHKVGEIERPWTFDLPVFGTLYEASEDPRKHFTIHGTSILSQGTLREKIKKMASRIQDDEHSALIFIHGYNVGFNNAAYRTAQIAHDLQFGGVPFLFSWPSSGSLEDYEYDQQSARQARRYLEQFLGFVKDLDQIDTVNIIAHSMGNDPLLEVLAQLAEDAAPKGKKTFNEIILAAPDVDRDVFVELAENMSRLSNYVTLYASGKDRAMTAARAYAGGVPRAGDVPADGPPVIASSVETVDATALNTDFLSMNHSDYVENRQLLEDIGRLINEGIHPPDRRNSTVRTMRLATGLTYWLYPQ